MKISEDGLTGANQRILGRQRLLDLNDQIGTGENLSRGGDDLGSLGCIFDVRNAGTDASVGLDQYLMASTSQLLHAHGQHGHAVFVALDLARDANEHERLLRRGKRANVGNSTRY